MAIPVTAQSVCTAHAFIDFIMDAENGATLTNFNFYASPNAAAREFILPEILEDPAIFPPEDVMANMEVISGVGEASTAVRRRLHRPSRAEENPPRRLRRASAGDVGVAVGAGPDVVAVGSAPVFPAAFVFGPVVELAQWCQVPFQRGSTVDVASGVIEVGGAGGSAASGEHAGAVSGP